MHPTEETTGVFRLPVFTPFDTEPTNAYVLLGERVGLFDTGLKHPQARDDLRRGLAELGLEPRDVDVVFISHAHVDHHGLAHEFSEAAVMAGPEDVHKLQDFPGHVGAFARAVQRLLPRWGVPASLLGALETWSVSMAAMGDSVSRAAGLPAGEVVSGFGDPWTVLALPGHTEGGLGLYRETDGVLLVGDHLLERITPNPGLYLFLDPVGSGLGDYMASLDALRTMGISLVLPGHGRPFRRVAGRIDEIVEQYDLRVLDVQRAFEGGSTVFRAVSRLFPGVDTINGFLAMGEVFGHAERLVAAGALRRDREGEVDVYGTAPGERRAAGGERRDAPDPGAAGAESEGAGGGRREEPR
ncbi:MAG: MBL fold metallo-hydrolase [Actinobacteria bacterium]|nr:MBL fold metallo-hydrolase [Actinomycetota bacterium]